MLLIIAVIPNPTRIISIGDLPDKIQPYFNTTEQPQQLSETDRISTSQPPLILGTAPPHSDSAKTILGTNLFSKEVHPEPSLKPTDGFIYDNFTKIIAPGTRKKMYQAITTMFPSINTDPVTATSSVRNTPPIMVNIPFWSGDDSPRTSGLGTVVFNSPIDSIIKAMSDRGILKEHIGSGAYIPLSRFYTSVDDVISDLNIDTDIIQTCNMRMRDFRDEKYGGYWKNVADEYYNSGGKLHSGLCLDLSDSLDWLVLQVAIQNNDNVIIPSTGKDYVVNQSLFIPSNRRIEWQVPYSFVRFHDQFGAEGNGSGALGGMFAAQNAYSGNPTLLKEMVQNIEMINPHIDAGSAQGFTGENALGFARGVRDITISGGVIRNVRFDLKRQGGKAIQCEQGCEDLKINDILIKNATFGISSGVHDNNQGYIIDPGMYQSELYATNIRMENVDIPFFFFNSYPADEIPDYSSLQEFMQFANTHKAMNQKVIVDGFTIINSGSLLQTDIINGTDSYLGISACPIDEVYLRTYHTGSQFYPPDASGIFGFHGGRNIDIKNGTITIDGSYGPVGGLLKGSFLANVSIKNVSVNGNIHALFNHTSGINGVTSPAKKWHSKNIFAENIILNGKADYIIKMPAPTFRNNKMPCGSKIDNSENISRVKYLDVGFEQAERFINDFIWEIPKSNFLEVSLYNTITKEKYSIDNLYGTKSCSIFGGTLAHGDTLIKYSRTKPIEGTMCSSFRHEFSCSNGILSEEPVGNYYDMCSE